MTANLARPEVAAPPSASGETKTLELVCRSASKNICKGTVSAKKASSHEKRQTGDHFKRRHRPPGQYAT
jgi:hypothetical protein